MESIFAHSLHVYFADKSCQEIQDPQAVFTTKETLPHRKFRTMDGAANFTRLHSRELLCLDPKSVQAIRQDFVVQVVCGAESSETGMFAFELLESHREEARSLGSAFVRL